MIIISHYKNRLLCSNDLPFVLNDLVASKNSSYINVVTEDNINKLDKNVYHKILATTHHLSNEIPILYIDEMLGRISALVRGNLGNDESNRIFDLGFQLGYFYHSNVLTL